METKDILLSKYEKVWNKVDEISKETDMILKSSAFGQAPPCFHKAVDKQLKIIEKEATPIWENLKSYIRSNFQTYWQFTMWGKGTLPPHYKELKTIK